jgi:hypothetical protein
MYGRTGRNTRDLSARSVVRGQLDYATKCKHILAVSLRLTTFSHRAMPQTQNMTRIYKLDPMPACT